MVSRLRAALLTVLIVTAVIALPAAAQTLNVGPGQTYTNIQSAINAAVDGTTVLVAPGVYNESIDFLGKYITVTSSGGASVTTIDGSTNPSSPSVTISPEGAQHTGGVLPIVINGFTIQNGGTNPSSTPTGGVFVYELGPTISNNVITQNHCAGIWIETYIASPIVSNNVITGTHEFQSDCAVGGGAGIVVTTTGLGGIVPPYAPAIITGNSVHDNLDGGQSGTGGGGLSLFVPATVENNNIYNNVSGATGGGLYIADSGVIVAQNLIYNNQAECGGGGISVQRLTANYVLPLQIVSNTFVNNSDTEACIYTVSANASQIIFADPESAMNPTVMVNNIVSGTSTLASVACNAAQETSEFDNVPVIDHNLIFNAAGQGLDDTCSDPATGYGNLFGVAPGFVNPANDFHVQSGSPAIDIGNTTEILQEVTTPAAQVNNSSDFDGNVRVVDSTGKGYAVVDMGAYEYTGSQSPQATTIALTVNGLASYYPVEAALPGQEAQFVATVTSAASPAGCTGPVTFIQDGIAVGSIALNGSLASFSVLLAPGVHRFTATYSGAAPCSPGEAVEVIFVVSKYVTELTLDSSVNPVVLGQPVTFTTTLSSADPNQPGRILLSDGTTLLASLTPNQHLATYTTSTLSLGPHGISAVYNGDADHYPSIAPGFTQYVVNAAVPTSVAVTSSSNPSIPGQDVYFYASVTSSAGTPTGSVTFSEGTTTYSTQTLVNGAAQFDISTLSPGYHTITAAYTPTGAFTASSGSMVQQVASQTSTTLVITAAGAEVSSVGSGTAVTLTATVATSAARLTTGQVNFCDATAKYCTDIHLLGTAQITSAGTATMKLVPGIGPHQYKAIFVGTNTENSSVSNIAPLTVTGIEATTTQLAASGIPGNYTLTGDVFAFGNALPSGTIRFLDTTNADYQLGSALLGQEAATLFNSSTPALPGVTRGAALADVNGDGILDILADSGNSIQVLYGIGDGTFTRGPNSPTGAAPEYFGIGDFNRDGILDIAVPNYSDNTVSILLGNGDGTFRTSQTIPNLGTYTYKVTVADFDGDGIPDLAVTDSSDVTVYILLGNGDGTFRALAPFPVLTPGSTFGGYTVAADFNGDGKMDLAVSASSASSSQPQIVVLLGNGDGTFTQQPLNAAAAFLSDSFAVADFNGDGIPDIVAAAGTAPTFTSLNETIVLLGNGDGTFTLSQTFNTGATSPVDELTYAVAVGDFNGDTIPDFAVTTITANPGTSANAGNTVTLFLGKGDGTFAGSVQVDTGELPLQVAVGDINSDGVSDLITANYSSQNVSVFLSASESIAVLDGVYVVGTGTHYAVAKYPGNANTLPSTSNLVPLDAQGVPTALELVAYPSNVQFNQPVTLNAILSPTTQQDHNAGGEVSFMLVSGASFGSAPLKGNLATLNVKALPVGTDCIIAMYDGDLNFLTSTSNQVCFVIGPPPAILQLAATPNPVFLQNPVTLTATVAAPSGSSAAPTGTVTFEDGTTPLGTATIINNGVASLDVSTLTLGFHSLTAVYNGNSLLGVSTSPVVVELVEDFALAAVNPNVTIYHGGTAAYSLTLGAVGGATTPGPVSFTLAGAPDSSVVTLSPSSVAAGSSMTPVTLTIQTPNYPVGPWNSASVRESTTRTSFGGSIRQKACAALGFLSLGALLLLGRRQRKFSLRIKGLASLLVLLALTGLSGCGSGWKTQKYTIVITAASGKLTHLTTLYLTTECADGKAACPIEK